MIEVACGQCSKKVFKHPYKLKAHKNLYCSKRCLWTSHKGYKHTDQSKAKIAATSTGRSNKGWVMSESAKKKLSDYAKNNPPKHQFKKGVVPWNKGKEVPAMQGKNHPFWIADRSQLSRTRNNRGDSIESIRWSRAIKKRDKHQCKLLDDECKGHLVAHHIIPFRDCDEELKYKINNGITLCQFHHPRKRDDEQRLIPVFQELVGSN